MFPRSLQRDASQMLILSVLADKPLYGYAITKEVEARSNGELKMTPGVLYPMLATLERSGLISATWEVIRSDRRPEEPDDDEGGRRRKWYRLTPKGRRHLAQSVKAHNAYVAMLRAFLPQSSAAPEEETP
ncbi:MAG TPA: PadR family transcriptional regulator [Phycisphaerales bacterium]|nr:PadR family transcriptional regulator [Phycisphaerales bacterium]